MAIFSCKNVKIIRQNNVLLENISFDLEKGDCLGISASSGTGKTSLLRLICALDVPKDGTLFFQGQPYEKYAPQKLRQKIGLVAQKPCLLKKTVREELMYPVRLRGKRVQDELFSSLLKSINLPDGTLFKRCAALSGGEQQRICLLRTLLAEPEILLLDEACACLDTTAKAAVAKLLQKKRQEGLTIIFVTHDSADLKKLSNKILVLEKATLSYCGTTKTYFTEEKK